MDDLTDKVIEMKSLYEATNNPTITRNINWYNGRRNTEGINICTLGNK